MSSGTSKIPPAVIIAYRAKLKELYDAAGDAALAESGMTMAEAAAKEDPFVGMGELAQYHGNINVILMCLSNLLDKPQFVHEVAQKMAEVQAWIEAQERKIGYTNGKVH